MRDERCLNIGLLIREGLVTGPGGTLQNVQGLLVCSQMRVVKQREC
jgi:hypothetical protein